MNKDIYGNKLNGFYLVGFFDKGKQPKFLVQTNKPFETDENGKSFGKCFPSYPHNSFPTDWEFIETEVKIKDSGINNDTRIIIDDIWAGWCMKHKRKLVSLFNEDKLKELE